MSPIRSLPRPLLLLALGGALLVIGLAVLVSLEQTRAFDRAIIDAVRTPAIQGLAWVLGPITELGSTWAIILMSAVVFVFAAAIGPWRHGLIGGVVIGLASAANSTFKLLIARERPELFEPVVVERGFSFPSGHSALGMVAYGILAVLVHRSRLPLAARRTIIGLLAVLIVLIGLSRVWLGVHFPTDVLAGWATGGVIVAVYVAFTRRVSPEPAEGAVDADPAAPRSDPPAPG
jgi:undecaprenyl-diphosphatase